MHLAAFLMSVAVAAATGAFALPGWFEVKGGSWVVDDSAVTAMSQDIQSAVRTLAGGGFKLFSPWARYTFQYQGQGSEGAPYVLVNAFCSSHSGTDLTASFVEVFDGGACYFKVKYDPRTHKFFDLSVNGYA
jgi:hypothetical protein